MNDVTSILSIDFEDWNEIGYRRATGETPPPANNLARQTHRLLNLLAGYGTHATFFCLGMTAEKNLDLLHHISAAGHEIACHGYAHLPAHALSPAEFRADTQRSKELLEQTIGRVVRGYRAAEFSIGRKNLWALEILAELGFTYDSSIFPVRHRRYGIAKFSSQPARYALPNGAEITEIPLATADFLGMQLPAAGGGYFRLMPQTVIHRAMKQINDHQRPAVTYFHPYEFDSQKLRIFETARPKKLALRLRAANFQWHQNLRRQTIPGKLASLLQKFKFVSCEDFLKGAQLGERRSLLPA